MSEITQVLAEISSGDESSTERLLPLVYNELRSLAKSRMAMESASSTLQPTALVHEAYLRLVGVNSQADWNSRAHFFGAASTAMRRILVEAARRKSRVKHGGNLDRQQFEEQQFEGIVPDDELLALDESLDQLKQFDAQAAKIVELRYFGGLTVEETAQAVGISPRSVKREWSYARAWLRVRLEDTDHSR